MLDCEKHFLQHGNPLTGPRCYQTLVRSVRKPFWGTHDFSEHNVHTFPRSKQSSHRLWWFAFITGRNEVVAKVMFFSGVCDSVHGGGGLPQCMLGYHPPDQVKPLWDQAHHSPEPDTPPDQAHTPRTRHTPPPGIRSMSGWYASYWNAFLLRKECRLTSIYSGLQ